MSIAVDADHPGMNPTSVAEAPLPKDNPPQIQERPARRGLRRFFGHRLGNLATAALFALGLGVHIADKPSNPDSSDASKVPPVPAMMAGSRLPDSTPSELKSSSAEKQEFTKDQQDFIEIMSGFLAPDVIGKIKDAFGGRGGLPKQFTVSDSVMSRGYIFQFPKPPDGKTELGLTMIDLFLQNQGNVVWHAQTADANIPPEFPNQRPTAVVSSEQELARKAQRFLAPRYKPQKPIYYSDKYSYKVGGRFPTPDGGEEWWGASAEKVIDDIVPASIYLRGEVTPPHSSEWGLDPSKASGKPDPLQRIPR